MMGLCFITLYQLLFGFLEVVYQRVCCLFATENGLRVLILESWSVQILEISLLIIGGHGDLCPFPFLY